MSILVFWVLTPSIFSPEDGDNISLRNVGIYLQVLAALSHRRPTSTSSPPLKPQISILFTFSYQFTFHLCICFRRLSNQQRWRLTNKLIDVTWKFQLACTKLNVKLNRAPLNRFQSACIHTASWYQSFVLWKLRDAECFLPLLIVK
jgi:hypothetical protein